jgi:DNA-binding HxlR family transcriptional regulator
MNIIGNKWTSIIVYVLSDNNYRFGELAFRIENISRKVLTSQLKEMEKRGILNRKVFAETPPRVEYSLTEKGKELIPILNQLCDWSNEVIAELE